ncbi:MAG: TetR/AcrR family transcriptional regulator [Polyangiaceae bacterium]
MPSPTKPLYLQRKSPKQVRSRETVGAILEAAARILVRHGYTGANTNRIAEDAGISVGSLYQYFPSKDAIVVELFRRYRARVVETVARHMDGVDRANIETRIHDLLRSLIEAQGLYPGLHAILIEQVLRTSARAEMMGFEERVEAILVEALGTLFNGVSPSDHEIVAFLLLRTVMAITHAAVVDRPALTRDPRLVREATRMIVRYLVVTTPEASGQEVGQRLR